jgi:uridine phosphorylase
VIAREAICADGTSRALGAGERAHADRSLTQALAHHAPAALLGTVVSVDLFYETGDASGSGERADARTRHGDAVAVEMEAAALFAIGARTGVPVACVLAVSDVFDTRGARVRIDEHTLLAAAETMGRAAIAALSG